MLALWWVSLRSAGHCCTPELSRYYFCPRYLNSSGQRASATNIDDTVACTSCGIAQIHYMVIPTNPTSPITSKLSTASVPYLCGPTKPYPRFCGAFRVGIPSVLLSGKFIPPLLAVFLTASRRQQNPSSAPIASTRRVVLSLAASPLFSAFLLCFLLLHSRITMLAQPQSGDKEYAPLVI